jgi:hypothetical protein
VKLFLRGPLARALLKAALCCGPTARVLLLPLTISRAILETVEGELWLRKK